MKKPAIIDQEIVWYGSISLLANEKEVIKTSIRELLPMSFDKEALL